MGDDSESRSPGNLLLSGSQGIPRLHRATRTLSRGEESDDVLTQAATATPLALRLTILPPSCPPTALDAGWAAVHERGQKSRSERPWPGSFRPAGTRPHLPGNDTRALTWD